MNDNNVRLFLVAVVVIDLQIRHWKKVMGNLLASQPVSCLSVCRPAGRSVSSVRPSVRPPDCLFMLSPNYAEFVFFYKT